MSISTRSIGFILISTSCFSIVNVMVKFLEGFPAHELIFFRSIISLFLTWIILKRKKLPVLGTNKKWLLIRGFSGVAALLLFFITLQRIPFANAVAIQYLSPLFTAVFGIFLLKERVRNVQWLFFAVAIAGTVVIKGFDPRVDWIMIFFGILSAAFSGLAYNAVRKVRDSEHPLQVVFYFPLVATPVMLIWCFFNFKIPQGIEWLWIALLGILTQIAQYYMTMALHGETASRITPFKYVGAVLAIIFGYVIFGEQLTYFNYLGMVLIMLGVFLNAILKHPAEKKPISALR